MDEALESIDYDQVGPPRIDRPASGRDGVSCFCFEMELVEGGRGETELTGIGPLALMGVRGEGAVELHAGGESARLELGQTLLVPARVAGRVAVTGSGGLGVLAVRARGTGG